VLSGEATNTNFIVFGLTRPGLDLLHPKRRTPSITHLCNEMKKYCLLANIILMEENPVNGQEGS